MDKTLFSSALLRLIADNDRFYFPGFGVICTEERPAVISDTGEILPPGRTARIEESIESDEKLLEAYMNISGKDKLTAVSELESYLREVRKSLYASGEYVFEGVGILKIDKEGVPVLEIPDTECLSADDFGFGKLSLKVLKREIYVENPDSEEIPDKVPSEETPVEKPVEKKAEVVVEDKAETAAPPKKVKTWLVVLLVGLALIMFFFILLIIFKDDIASAFTEMLYSQDELDLIRRSRFSA